jgi:hypothetical protein
MAQKGERVESLFRIIVLVVTGIVLYLWSYVAYFTIFINWLFALIVGRRSKDLGEFNEYWASAVYEFSRYISGVTNKRPFPFTELKKFGKFEK